MTISVNSVDVRMPKMIAQASKVVPAVSRRWLGPKSYFDGGLASEGGWWSFIASAKPFSTNPDTALA